MANEYSPTTVETSPTLKGLFARTNAPYLIAKGTLLAKDVAHPVGPLSKWTLLAQKPGTQNWVPFDAASSDDDAKVIGGILVGPADCTSAAQPIEIYVMGEYIKDSLVIASGAAMSTVPVGRYGSGLSIILEASV